MHKFSLIDMKDIIPDLQTAIPAKLSQALLDPDKEIPEEEAILYIKGVCYGTKGNISTITGKAKSKKSMFLSGWVASVMGGNSFSGFKSGVKNGNIKGAYFDTEQSYRHCYQQYHRISKLLGEKPGDKLVYYMLRAFGPAERLEMIEQAIYSQSDWSFVVIDGIADLLSKGVNDEEEAIRVTNLLMKWSLEKGIHIVTVLHQNKGDNNAKGHIGSQLVQKSETVLSIEKDPGQKEISIVSSPYARGMEIEPIHFALDHLGNPYVFENFKTEVSSKKTKDPFDYEQEVTYGILKQVFREHKEITYSLLNDKIRHILGKHSIKIGERKCRDWINYYREEMMIIQEGSNKPYSLNNEWQGGVAWHP